MQDSTDRRKKKRFLIEGEAFIKVYQPRKLKLLKPRAVDYGPIVDISSSGVSVLYVDESMRSTEPTELTITMPNNSFQIENINFTTISDYKVSETDDRQSIRRRSMRFEKLTASQTSHLNHLIDHYARKQRGQEE